jgi:3-oxoacyl-[acyl-carrier-protein] synthase II/nodulation protein E
MSAKDVRRTDLVVQYGVAAARQAVADAGLEIAAANAVDVGVVFGCGGFGQSLVVHTATALRERGPRAVNPFYTVNGLVDAPAAWIAILTGARGFNGCIAASCATGTHNIAQAAELIGRGELRAVIAGSVEAPLVPHVYAGFASLRALGAPRPGRPAADASRPFDRSRNGFVLAEGACALILEELESAKARRARVYAEVVGSGATADAFDMIAPAPHGEGSARAMRLALDRARVAVGEVDLINPHGSSTRLGDRAEAEAIRSVFGAHSRSVAISATKSMTGHMMGATGSFEAFASVMSLHQGWIPPTLNYLEPDPGCDLAVVTQPMRRRMRYVMSNNLGLGGHNSALVFARYDGD